MNPLLKKTVLVASMLTTLGFVPLRSAYADNPVSKLYCGTFNWAQKDAINGYESFWLEDKSFNVSIFIDDHTDSYSTKNFTAYYMPTDPANASKSLQNIDTATSCICVKGPIKTIPKRETSGRRGNFLTQIDGVYSCGKAHSPILVLDLPKTEPTVSAPTNPAPHSEDHCFQRTYDQAHLAKNPKQIAAEVVLKISTDPTLNSASSGKTANGGSISRTFILNIVARPNHPKAKGGTYVYRANGSAFNDSSMGYLKTAQTEISDSGYLDLAYSSGQYLLTLEPTSKSTPFFETVWQHATCNDGLECKNLNAAKSTPAAFLELPTDKNNQTYLLNSVDCSTVKIVDQVNPE